MQQQQQRHLAVIIRRLDWRRENRAAQWKCADEVRMLSGNLLDGLRNNEFAVRVEVYQGCS